MKRGKLLAALSVIAKLIFISLFATAQEHKPLRDFQLSIVPSLGTEGRNSSDYRYRVSLNLFSGITGGVEGFEAGGFMNINTGPVKGAQISGFGNFVHDNFEGFQGAGFMNINNADVKAFTGAGFINLITGSAEGFIGAGFLNIIGGNGKNFSGAGFANIVGGNSEGAQMSGFANVIGGNFEGFRASGFANVTGGSFKGFQAAGFANVTGGEADAFQAAGLANITGNFCRGPQFAGFMNISRDISGAQFAGFLNIAEKVKGLQLGFLNIADTISGVPIGFISIVKKGAYRQFEISASDAMHLGVSFRIGVPHFYNIFTYSARPFDSDRIWGFGYGIGTGIGFSASTDMQLELHSTQMRNSWRREDVELDLLNELRLTVGTILVKRLQLFAGPVLYNHVFKHLPESGITGADIANYTLSKKSYDDITSEWWIGVRGGLRMRLTK